MTPKEMQAALIALRTEIGPKADVSVFIQDKPGVPPIYASINPNGIGERSDIGYIYIQADDFDDALAKLKNTWAEHAAQFRAKAIRKMALAIISITADQGQCTDAALRGAGLSAADVKHYGAEACAFANEMAGKGPFQIVTLGGANGAPDHVEPTARVQ